MNKYNLPKPLKALVIENDYQAPGSIRGLIKDNPEYFPDVDTASHARFRPQDVMGKLQGDIDTVIVSSTFMYKDQLEDLVLFIDSLNRPFYFLIQFAEHQINSWFATRRNWNASSFNDFDAFKEIIKKWVLEGRVFEVEKDRDSEVWLRDDCHDMYGSYEEMDRKPWTLKQIQFNEEHNVFHADDDKMDTIIDLVRQHHGS